MDLGSLFEVTTLDIVLLALLAVLAYRWYKRTNEPEITPPKPNVVPPIEMQDLTLAQLRKYNGVDDEHIFFALKGNIYDVSRGRSFYGPEGPYGVLAGRDATRPLATMDLKTLRDEWDDHEDLDASQKETVDDWESSFKHKYPLVGKLIKDGEEPTNYDGKISAPQ